MNPIVHRIVKILITEYPILKDVQFGELTDDHINRIGNQDCDGFCEFRHPPKLILNTHKHRILHYTPICIYLRTQGIPVDNIALTIAHECAHAITNIEENKVNNRWIRDNDHSDSFYKSYSQILRLLEQSKVFTLNETQGYSKFSSRNLQKLDRYRSSEQTIPVGKLLIGTNNLKGSLIS